jgi:hypothetical protein
MRAAASFVLLFAVSGFAQNYVAHLSGEVARGQEFRREIGPGLQFALVPSETGWMIGISPSRRCLEPDDWASVVNAPYRNYNSLYVDTGYGVTAREAVDITPREFSFLTNCEDYKREFRRLEIVLWPADHSQKEADEALATLGTSPLGKGRFTILDSRVSPAADEIEGKNYGKIDWLRFRLDISPPAAPKRKGPSGAIAGSSHRLQPPTGR